jgi:hypothetical protein
MTSSGSLWTAILITVVASTASSIGKALQKEATRNLPKFSLEEKILRQYVLDKTWVTGLTSDLAGGVIQIFAFALAPVSIIQPVSGVGLVGLAVYTHFFLKEKLADWEWAAVGLAGLGTLGLGASSSSSSTAAAADDAASRPPALRMLFVLIMVGFGVASLRKLRQRHRHNKSRSSRGGGGGGDKALAALYGLQAGGCFGLSAACCRTGFLMSARRWTWIPFGLAASVALSATGFILQTQGLQSGATVVVCTCVAVTSMVTGVLVGLLGLGETMPGSFISTLVRLTSWNLILIGVVALASGPGGMQELLVTLLQRIPPQVWQKLPTEMAVRLKSWATSRGSLPEVAAGHAHSNSGSNSVGGTANSHGGASSPSPNTLRRPPQPPAMASA